MARISIIGTGNMGQAIAAIAGKGANTVEQLNTSDADKQDRKSTRLNSSHSRASRMPSSA